MSREEEEEEMAEKGISRADNRNPLEPLLAVLAGFTDSVCVDAIPRTPLPPYFLKLRVNCAWTNLELSSKHSWSSVP